MKKLIIAIGDIEISLRSDHLSFIVHSIEGQQFLVKPTSIVYARLVELLGSDIKVEGIKRVLE